MCNQNLFHNTRQKIIFIIISVALFASKAESMVFIEQFTSTECKICQEAEDNLTDIATKNDALIISYHVDYWDYLGKPDPFANPFFSQRQIVYQYQYGERYIYTPQAIINGKTSVDAADATAMEQAISATDMNQKIIIKSEEKDNKIFLTLTPKTVGALDSGVYSIILARILPNGTKRFYEVEDNQDTPLIARNHVVDALDSLGQWDGKAIFEAEIPIPENAGLVVFVQIGAVGEVIGAKHITSP